MRDLNSVGIYVGGDYIPSFTPAEIVTSKEKYFLQMEYYMRRKNKCYLRNKSGQKLQFEVSELPQDIKDLKYGTVLRCEFTV